MSSDWYIFIANAYLLPCSSCSSAYPAIRSDAERHDYKREFDADLKEYKRLCAEMDDINDHLNKLSRQLDTLDDTSAKYQVRYTQKLSPNLMKKAKHVRHIWALITNQEYKIIPLHCKLKHQ